MTANPTEHPSSRHVLGMRVDHVEPESAVEAIVRWAAGPAPGRMVCAANVHMTMEAHDDPEFQMIINRADLVLPDGVPMVWALRALGLPQRRRARVAPDLLLELFAECEIRGLEIGLYGGTEETLAAFERLLEEAAPDLKVAYACSPPFRPLTASEDAATVEHIKSAGVKLLLVGLGCPKQERWMADHAPRLPCVTLGVGAAFDMFAGKTGNAPLWMQDVGIEWLFRLSQEPRRLFRRYLLHNPRFLLFFALQLALERAHRPRGARGREGPLVPSSNPGPTPRE